jgi:hypothetical protein
VKRAIFLATAALLAMLVLVPMAMGQDRHDASITPSPCLTTMGSVGCYGVAAGGGGARGATMVNGSPFPPLTPETGGSAILLPAASLLLGSGILTYAFLRRR